MQSMKAPVALALLSALQAQAEETNPLGQVVSLMNELAAKVTKDKEAEAKAYKDYFEWCDDASSNKNNEIKTATALKEKLEATIAELTANLDATDTKIGELVNAISTGTSDLDSATKIREKEAADFAASEKDLVEAVDTLGRALNILEREMAKNPAALAQISTSDMSSVVQGLSVIVEAAGFAASDKNRLVALVQSQQDSQDEDTGAPAAAVYKSQSGGIVDVIADMQSKAEEELAELRKSEKNAQHNFNMLKQSLEDQLAVDNKDLDEAKARKAADSEAKGDAQGELSVTMDDLKTTKASLETANANCMEVAADHEATVRARDEELKVIAEATAILQKTTGGAEGQTYSFLQLKSHADLARSEVIVLVKKLAREEHSAALNQLASRISAVMRYGAASGDDPFAKIKGLIQDMIAKLESEAKSEATEKAYCDDELSKTTAKKSELDTEIAKLTTKIDRASAHSSALKGEVAELQAELATMEKEQADNTKWREEEHADYVTAKADLELGLSGVRKALEVLRTYYGGAAFVQQPAKPETFDKSTGAGQSIIGVLEVVESDFADNLAKVETAEADAQSTYDTYTQDYKVNKAQKDADVKYKTQEFTGLDKSIADLSSDRATANEEVSAVNEYLAKLKDRCIAKPETYEERKKRRDAEINGLKEALNILENETAFTQRKSKGRHMRGSLAPH